MATVAVLGMGLLGSGFAFHRLESGDQVRVWNRTAAKCELVGAAGAYVASSPADAVAGADRVHLVLAEDRVVELVLEQLLEALPAGCPIIDHSTNLPASVSERASRLAAQGVTYLHAPVFMGPANSRAGTGLMLVSGEAATVSKWMPDLALMTGKVLAVGDEPGRAATLKLAGNGMLMQLIWGMGDLFALGQANGVEPDAIVELFQAFAPSAAGMGQRILASGDAAVGFELTMARKDVRLMIEAAEGQEMTVLPAIAEGMDRAIAQGRGAEDFTAVARPAPLVEPA